VTVEEKALELVAENRVVLEPGDQPWVAIVAGHHDHYTVTCEENDVWCDCPARGRCAHVLAVMVAFYDQAERDKRQFEKPW
jgi:uncharacterized Zn finger protein